MSSPPAPTPLRSDPRLRRASTALRVKGIAMVFVAAVHTLFVPPTFAQASQEMVRGWAVDFSLWFGIAGLYFAFMGAMDLATVAGLRRGEPDAWRTAMVSSVFGTLTGAGGASWAILKSEPAGVFPATIFLVGLLSLTTLLAARRGTGAEPQAAEAQPG